LQRSEPIPDESVFGFGGQCEDHARVLMVHVMFFLVGISFGPRPRPVRLIVGWPPGGVADMFGRLMGQLLSERPGQQVVVENRAGAGGNLAVEAVLKAARRLYAAHDWFKQRVERDALRQPQLQFSP
jgi:hypothetical protein